MGCGTGALGACGTFAQILVFLVNTVLFAGSVLLVVGSVFLLHKDNAIVQFIDVNNPNQVAYIGICLGAVTAFISFFGCAGSCSQSKNVIRLYLVMLVILFILFLTIIIMGATYKKSLKGNLQNGMRNSLTEIERNKNTNETEKLMIYWNDMQKEISCCGLTGWEDWNFNPVIMNHQDHEGRSILKSHTGIISQVATSSTTTTTLKTTPADATMSSTSTTISLGARKRREAKDILTTKATQLVTDQPDYITQEILNRLPISCFINGNKTEVELHKEGCRDRAKIRLDLYVNLVLYASGGVGIVLVFSILISCWLLKSVKRALAYNF